MDFVGGILLPTTQLHLNFLTDLSDTMGCMCVFVCMCAHVCVCVCVYVWSITLHPFPQLHLGISVVLNLYF